MKDVCEDREQPGEMRGTRLMFDTSDDERRTETSDNACEGNPADNVEESVKSVVRLKHKVAPAGCVLEVVKGSGREDDAQGPEKSSSDECHKEKSTCSSCSTASTKSSSTLSSSSKHVSFKDMEIRSYPIILGDNPNCSCGPPIQIDWKPFRIARYSIDEYEAHRKSRRTREELELDYWARKKMLRRCARCTEDEIIERVREMSIIQKHRRRTARRAGMRDSIIRKFTRVLHIRDAEGNKSIPNQHRYR